MKAQKLLLFIFVLPVTLLLDLILFAFIRNCPSCGSFSQFIASEGALSFPMVVGLTQWFSQVVSKFNLFTRR